MMDLPLLQYAERATVALDYLRPGTSQRAALEAAKMAAPNFLKVIEALAEKPQTPDEIARTKGMVLNTARARCSNLRNPRDPVTGRRIAPFAVPVGTGKTDADKEADTLRLTTPQERAEWTPSDPKGGPIEQFPITDEMAGGAI
jgi:hypothetical protein